MSLEHDDSHHENVWPMVEACKAMGVDVRTCSEICCDDWFREAAPKASCSFSDLCFAAGYLQATSNLTRESWADQLTRVVKEREDTHGHA